VSGGVEVAPGAIGTEAPPPSLGEGGEARRLYTIVITLAITNFKLRYHDSALGYLWSLMRPLLVFGVLYFALTDVLNYGGGITRYPAVLITGLVLFEFFAGTTSEAVASLVESQSLLRKISLPPLAIPLSIVLRNLFDLGPKLVIVLFFLIISGTPVTLGWLQFPFLLAILVVMSLGFSGLLSTLYVSYRDVQPIWEAIVQLLFWSSAIVYTIESVPANVSEWLMLNPLGLIVTQVRHAVIDQSAAPGWTYLASPAMLVIPAGIILGSLVGAVLLYRRTVPHMAEQL
jgi:ABC-2 type transport system permease protein